MYFWNTKKLAEQIKNGNFSEQDKMQYYLGYSILSLLQIFIISLSYTIDIELKIFEYASYILIATIGIKINFATNKGNNGSDFISRSIALLFPITIKLLLLLLVTDFALDIVSSILNMKWLLDPWLTTILGLPIFILSYYLCNVHLKNINS